jgi:hypothetical protein
MMHADGFVHADIRAFNIVFNGDEGRLIDFDFSGKVGEAKYPDGYVHYLDDGHRVGRSLQKVEKWHDWAALLNVIFVVHGLQPPLGSIDLLNRWNDLLWFFNTDQTPEAVKGLAGELITFLKAVEGELQFRPTNAFKEGLAKFKLQSDHWPIRKNTETASGSPKKSRLQQ